MADGRLAEVFWALFGNVRSSSAVTEDQLVVDREQFEEMVAAFREKHYPEPKKWHSARPGEIWDVDLETGGIRAVTVHGIEHRSPTVVFRDVYQGDEYDLTDTVIRDARPVWTRDAAPHRVLAQVFSALSDPQGSDTMRIMRAHHALTVYYAGGAE